MRVYVYAVCICVYTCIYIYGIYMYSIYMYSIYMYSIYIPHIYIYIAYTNIYIYSKYIYIYITHMHIIIDHYTIIYLCTLCICGCDTMYVLSQLKSPFLGASQVSDVDQIPSFSTRHQQHAPLHHKTGLLFASMGSWHNISMDTRFRASGLNFICPMMKSSNLSSQCMKSTIP